MQSYSQTFDNDTLQDKDELPTSRTSLNGYGNMFYQRNSNLKDASINLEKCMLILRHQFNHKISLYTEAGVEDLNPTKVNGNEIVIEQAYLKFQIHPNHAILGGLFLPRIGLYNENRFPTQYLGNERNYVETFIIPSTWRHFGLALNGQFSKLPLQYSIALVNGLNSATFEHGSVIREGRFNGRNVSANNLAVIASMQYKKNKIKAQISAYYGGSVNLTPNQADSLYLTSGFFGTPVMLGDVSVRYQSKRIRCTAFGSVVSIPDAASLNRAYANNTPELAYGAYAEIAFGLFQQIRFQQSTIHELMFFARYETYNMNAKIPSNGLTDQTLYQQHVLIGAQYAPIKNVLIKADIRFYNTGKPNPILMPNMNNYQQNNSLLSIGLAYAF